MTKQTQVVSLTDFRNRLLASSGCNLMWDDSPMTEEEKAAERAALERLDALTATFEATKEAHEHARDELRSAIAEILMKRQTTPGKVTAHTPYDRNHVRRIADAAGVPPLRERTVRSIKQAE